MPTRHGGSLAKNANTSLRLSLRATTTLPSASTPWTWNTFFARSSPMVVIVVMDGSSLVIRHQRSLYGTSMPSEAPSTSSRTASNLDRRRPAELVCFTPRKLTELLHRRVQSALCHEETHAERNNPLSSITSSARSKTDVCERYSSLPTAPVKRGKNWCARGEGH